MKYLYQARQLSGYEYVCWDSCGTVALFWSFCNRWYKEKRPKELRFRSYVFGIFDYSLLSTIFSILFLEQFRRCGIFFN